MKIIHIEEAIDLLENAAAVIVDGGYVTFPNTGSDQYFLCVAQDEAAVEAGEEICFQLQGNREVEVEDDGTMVLIDTEGQPVRLQLLVNPAKHEDALTALLMLVDEDCPRSARSEQLLQAMQEAADLLRLQDFKVWGAE